MASIEDSIITDRGRRSIRQGVIGTVAFHVFFAVWILVRPISPAVTGAGNDLFQTIGGLLAAAFCCFGIRAQGGWRAALRATDRRRFQVTLLFGAALLAYGLGQATWAVEDLAFGRATLPSWADAWYLPGYPLLLAGILMLPTQQVPTATRARIFLDSLISMTALVTFSWYYVLGPALLQRYLTPAGKATTLFYPTADLVLLFAVLWLQSRMMTGSMRRIAAVLSLGLLATIAADCYTTYQSLHSSTITISLLDMGWSLGYMPIGLAVSALMLPQEAMDQKQDRRLHPVSLWPSLLPYLLLPVFLALVLYTFRSHMPPALAQGVYIGGSVIVGLVLLRQVLAILENATLNSRLAGSYREVSESAEKMRQLNEELLDAHEELHRNLDALTTANARLEALATTDAISGLLNHRGTVDAIDAALERAHRNGNPCALLFLDLDRFKTLNDTHGHPAGDAALREVGSVLREWTRASDVLGRWGGEEFVVLLPDTDLGGAQVAAEAIRAGVAGLTLPIGDGVRLTCSLGLAVCPGHAWDRAGLVDAADRAMYAAKRLGRNQTRTADDPVVLALARQAAQGESCEDFPLPDPDTSIGGQNDHVALLVARLAGLLGLDAAAARALSREARLHDTTKAGISEALLRSL